MKFKTLGVVAALSLAAWSGVARAATFNIANGDVAALKSAINTANANDQADTINLATGGSYTLTTVDNTTNGSNGLPVIVDDLTGQDLTIIGNGATIARATTTGTPNFRLLQVALGTTATIYQTTFVNGKAVNTADPDTDAGFAHNSGGGLWNSGTLTLNTCTLNSNHANDGGQSQGGGGGIFSNGTLTMNSCTVSNNSYSGVIGWGETGDPSIFPSPGNALVTMNNCTVTGNTSPFAAGVFMSGYSGSATLNMTDCILSGNSAVAGGGAIGCDGSYNGHAAVTLLNCTLDSNMVTGDNSFGGALFTHSVDGDGGPAGVATLSLTGCTVSNNSLTGGGDVVAGGGIYNQGTLTAINSTIKNNHVSSTAADSGAGAIFNDPDVGSSSVTLSSCTLSGNTVGGNGASGSSSFGGGAIFNDASNGGNGVVTLTNCTLTANSAKGFAGAIENFGGKASLTLRSCTLSGNTAATTNNIGNDGDGSGAGKLTVGNTILNGGSIFNRGTITDQGYNLSSDNGGGLLIATGDQINTDPKLGALQSSGGPTQTMALLTGSSAIDKGKSFGATTDQRGFTRPADNLSISNAPGGDGSDIGAFEVQPVVSTFAVSGTISKFRVSASNPAATEKVPFAGVTVKLGTKSTVTDSAGNYSFSGVANNTYTITPQPLASTDAFSPASRSVTVSGADVSAVNFKTLCIIGRVYKLKTDGVTKVGLANAQVKLNGTVRVMTDAEGYYSIGKLGDGNYTVLPVLSGYSFQGKTVTLPTSGIVNISPNGQAKFQGTKTTAKPDGDSSRRY